MRKFELIINGNPVIAEVEPRMHLADFLRDRQHLTATHIGCEHGVCGACTVLIDGTPARSCITYAVACEGTEITTLEGLRDDPIMKDLRASFSDNHALQCGYCTPGMLISSRDIIQRVPEADEARIRLELSGNLCRCTGYVGIVKSVGEVLKRHVAPAKPPATSRAVLGPVGARTPAVPQTARTVHRAKVEQSPVAGSSRSGTESWREVEDNGTELVESFDVDYPRQTVWNFFADLDRVARCMPGARLSKPPIDGFAEGELGIKLGPIASTFYGQLEIERDPASFKGSVRGTGRDSKSGSGARAIVTYVVKSATNDSSRVDISIKFLLTGALAQFGRSGLIKDVADHLTYVFAENLKSALSGKTGHQETRSLSALALMWIAIKARLRRLLP